jgi:hypothetical protein
MKHLRRFNESLQLKELEDLMDFAENCLAYLLDEGFQLELVDRYGRGPNDPSFDQDTEHWLDLYGPTNGEDNRNFSWEEVKDYYIPFISLIKNRYRLVDDGGYKGDQIYFKVQLGRRFDEHTFMNYTVDEIISDKINIPKNDFNSYDDNIFSISVKIGGKL